MSLESQAPVVPGALRSSWDEASGVCVVHGLRLRFERELTSGREGGAPRVFRVVALSGGAFAEDGEPRMRLLYYGEGEAAQVLNRLHGALERLDPASVTGLLPEPLDLWSFGEATVLLAHDHLGPLDALSQPQWGAMGVGAALPLLIQLAKTLDGLHQAGYSLGVWRPEVFWLDARRSALLLAEVEGIAPLGEAKHKQQDLVRRDLKLVGTMLLSAALGKDAYELAQDFGRVLDDAQILLDLGLARPGLPQVLLGTLTGEPPFTYQSGRELLLGLLQLQAELRPSLRVRSAAASSVGNFPLRRTDQDSSGIAEVRVCYHGISRTVALYCVADGVGGEEHGERASQAVIHSALKALYQAVSSLTFEALYANPSGAARAIAKVAAQELAILGECHPDSQRGATTFTGLLVVGDRAGLAHVGDSRAYLLRDQTLTCLTRDHNVANMKAALAQLTGRQTAEREDDQRRISRFMGTSGETPMAWIDAFDPRLLGVLTLSAKEAALREAGLTQTLTELRGATTASGPVPLRAHASDAQVQTLDFAPRAEKRVFDVATEQEAWGACLVLQPGDSLVLMSDGLYGEMDEAAILGVLLDEPEPERSVHALLRAAMKKLVMDNVTVVHVRVDAVPSNA